MKIRGQTNKTQRSNHQGLSTKQVRFLKEFLERGRKSIFDRIFDSNRMGFMHAHFSEKWNFISYEDAGENWRKNSLLFCECGRRLRYRYTLESKTSGVQKHFGLNHLTEHTGIQPNIARQIVKELRHLERERHEIVQKCEDGWTLKSAGIVLNMPYDQLPADISWHLTAQMPLLERQVEQLKAIIQAKSRRSIEKSLQKIVAEEKRLAINDF